MILIICYNKSVVIKMKYLINETTKEERAELVYKALGISKSDADDPGNYALYLAKLYIDGVMELDEIQKKIVEYHKKEDE